MVGQPVPGALGLDQTAVDQQGAQPHGRLAVEPVDAEERGGVGGREHRLGDARRPSHLDLDVGDVPAHEVLHLGVRQVGEQTAHAAEAQRLEPGHHLGVVLRWPVHRHGPGAEDEVGRSGHGRTVGARHPVSRLIRRLSG